MPIFHPERTHSITSFMRISGFMQRPRNLCSHLLGSSSGTSVQPQAHSRCLCGKRLSHAHNLAIWTSVISPAFGAHNCSMANIISIIPPCSIPGPLDLIYNSADFGTVMYFLYEMNRMRFCSIIWKNVQIFFGLFVGAP